MRLVTYSDGAQQRVGALRDGKIADLSGVIPDMLTLIDHGDALLARLREVAATTENAACLEMDAVRLLAPIPRPRKNIVCLGLNYAEHAYESARAAGRTPALPKHPVFFTKAPTTVNAHEGTILYDPALSTELDYEVELAFIIGKAGKNIPAADALDYVFGYTIMNDISYRDLQRNHKQFYKSKSIDGSAPLGPCIVTADEIPDPHCLGLRTRVNEELRQDSNTSDMVYKIPDIIAILSRGMTLEPGDIIATGTPSGVGMGMEPPQFLVPGDVVELEIDQIGTLTSIVARAEA